jgi:hypothetical protein
MSGGERAGARLIARIRALLPEDWIGRAGKRFRGATQVISQFAQEHHVSPEELAGEAVDLTRRKLVGLANHEYASALKSFAEAEKAKIDAQLQQRVLESKVRKEEAEAQKEEAEARFAQVKLVQAEIELLQKLRELEVVLYRDARGNLTVLPSPGNCDLQELIQRRSLEAGPGGAPGSDQNADGL